MVERLCVQVDTIFKCSLSLVQILMYFIFQFYDNLNRINWKHFANICYRWSELLMRCILLIFCGKKIGGSCLQQLLKLILHAVYCHPSSHNFHWLKWKLKLFHSLESWRLLIPCFLFFREQTSYWTERLLLYRHWDWTKTSKRGKPIDMMSSVVTSIMCNT